jgi:4-hydroxy-tetrahydrodipicolinate reductase
MLASCIAQSDNLEVVCGFDTKPNTSDTFETYTSLNDVGEQIDCVIDFSHYTASSAITAFCVAKNLPLVSATTGLDAQAEETIREASQKIPVFRSKNFSYGINVLIKLSVQAAKLLGDFDAEIIEAHHNKKADAPSGTAQMLAEAVMAAEADERRLVYGRYGSDCKRKKDEITVHSLRGGTIPRRT